MKKAVIIVPLMEDEFNKREFSNREFLGPQYLVAKLRGEGIECDFINAHAYRLSNSEVCSMVIKEKYRFIGISCASQRSYPYANTLIKMLRAHGCRNHICLGGFFTSVAFQDILNDLTELDSILLGESEYAIYKLVQAVFKNENYYDIEGIAYLDNDVANWVEPKRIENLDLLPFPTRDMSTLGDMSVLGTNKVVGKFFRILAGRGCYGSCSFCTLISFYQPRHKIYRSVENVVSELEMLINRYGVYDFRFNDEIFYDLSKKGQEWIQHFVKTISEKRLNIRFNIELRADDVRVQEIQALKSIGLERVSIGAESAVQRILDEMRKGCRVEQIYNAINILRNNDIEVAVTFITIVPTMSFEELKINYDFLFETNTYNEENLYNKLNVYRGCEYVDILEKEKLLMESYNFYERHSYLYRDFRVECFAEVIDDIRIIISEINKDIYNSKDYDKMSFISSHGEKIIFRRELWKKIVLFMLSYLDIENRILCKSELKENVLAHIKEDLSNLRNKATNGLVKL